MRSRSLLGFNAATAVVLGIGGYYLGWFLGHHITGASVAYFSATSTRTTFRYFLGYFLGVIGFLIGLGFGVYPLGAAARVYRRLCARKNHRASAATSVSAPITRSSAFSTCAASGCSSSSAD